MSTELLTETLVSLAKAAREEVPTRPHHSTVWRWSKKGIKGVKLETVVIGGFTYTTREAVARCCERINEPAAPAPQPRTRREEKAAIAKAERILKRAGV